MADAVLVGNNLAVLVAAAELGDAGREVVLLTDGRAPGGHFRGMTVDGTDFDIGMVTLEQLGGTTPVSAVPDLGEYRPDHRYDWTRFAPLVDRWQEAHVDLRRTPTPEVLVEGRRWPDHLMSDRLDVLAELGSPPAELLPRDDAAHASAKTTGADYDTLTYAVAAERNHGGALQQRLVTPFADKVLGPLGDQLLARYHRAGWLPLYWPETVADACAGRPTPVREHPFWTTGTGFVGDVVRALERRIAAQSTVTVDPAAVATVQPADGGWEVRTTSGASWTHARPVLGLSPDRARDVLGLPPVEPLPGASVTVLCCLVRASAIREPLGCLLVLDPEVTGYRVTDQDAMAGRDVEWHRVVVEAGHEADRLAATGVDVPARLVAEVCRLMGIAAAPAAEGHPDVRVLRTLRAPSALAVPTATSVAAAQAAREDLRSACGSALLTGVLLGVGLNSLADQVVQGLAIGRQLA